jgi:hypothetical protein
VEKKKDFLCGFGSELISKLASLLLLIDLHWRVGTINFVRCLGGLLIYYIPAMSLSS